MGTLVLRISGIHRGSQGNVPPVGGSHVLEGDVRAVLAVLAQPAQIDRFLEAASGGNPRIGQAGSAVGHPCGGSHGDANIGRPGDLHSEGPDTVPGTGNGDAEVGEVADGVGLDSLVSRSQPVGGRAASASAVGGVGVVERCLLGPPVGQGQLRSEQGVIPPGCGQEDRDEDGRRVARIDGRRRDGLGELGVGEGHLSLQLGRALLRKSEACQAAQECGHQPGHHPAGFAPPRCLHGIFLT